MNAGVSIIGGVLLFLGGYLFGGWVGITQARHDFPPKPTLLHAPTPEEAVLLSRHDLLANETAGLVKLGQVKSSEVILYADLQAFDTLDERGTLTVPAGTYAIVLKYHPWNDSVQVRIATGPVKGREGITLRTNLRKLSR